VKNDILQKLDDAMLALGITPKRSRVRVAANLPPAKLRYIKRSCGTCRFFSTESDGTWDCTRPNGFYKDIGDTLPSEVVCDRWVQNKDESWR
jgi:hypothetical protein